MNKAQWDAQDYIHFLVAAQNVFSRVEAAATHPDGEGVVATLSISDIHMPSSGGGLHLIGYGFVKVFRTVDTHGNAEQWATSNRLMTDRQRRAAAQTAWPIDPCHRNLKQFAAVERAQFRREVSQPVGRTKYADTVMLCGN